MSIVLYVTLVICAFCAGLLVYRHDLYERESVPMLFLATVIGAGAMWCAGQVESWTFDLFDIRSGHALAAIAALEEELFKLLVVVAFALLVRKEFNDPMDGLVYGSIAGLGMALEESLYYLRDLSEGGGASLPPAELVRMLGHLVMGGISGYAVGPVVLGRSHSRSLLVSCFLAAVALHFGWDWIALSSPDEGLGTTQVLFEAALMLAGLLLYGALTTRGSRQSHALFAPSSPKRLWGWPFTKS